MSIEVLLVVFFVSIILFLAILRLFSIDKTLKKILQELSGEKQRELSPSVKQRIAQLQQSKTGN